MFVYQNFNISIERGLFLQICSVKKIVKTTIKVMSKAFLHKTLGLMFLKLKGSESRHLKNENYSA